jgi:ABC-type proline/glycine betaine transport system ATPase subunit
VRATVRCVTRDIVEAVRLGERTAVHGEGRVERYVHTGVRVRGVGDARRGCHRDSA